MTAARLCLSDTLKTGDFFPRKEKGTCTLKWHGDQGGQEAAEPHPRPPGGCSCYSYRSQRVWERVILTSKYDPRFLYVSVIKKVDIINLLYTYYERYETERILIWPRNSLPRVAWLLKCQYTDLFVIVGSEISCRANLFVTLKKFSVFAFGEAQ